MMEPDSEDTTPIDSNDIRCECGRLLARRVPGGIELKCRRCGRLLRMTIEVLGDVG